MMHLIAVGTYVQTHILGVLLAILASIVVGFIWHGPLFKNQWIRLSGLQDTPPEVMMRTMIPGLTISAITAFVQASVIGRTFELLLLPSILHAFIIATILWIPFTGLAFLNNYTWARKPFALFLIDGGSSLLSVYAMAAALYLTM